MRRGCDDRGAALVEAALVLPLLTMLLFGLVESGFAWRADNETARSVRGAVLEEARGGDDRLNDFRALETLRSTVGQHEILEWVIVYRTDTANSDPPMACVALAESLVGPFGGIADTCNVYRGTYAAVATESDFGGTDCALDPDRDFCPTGRIALLGPHGRIGVAVQILHTWVTGFPPGDGITLRDSAVSPLITGIGDLE